MILCKTYPFDATFRQGGTTVFSSGRIPRRVSDRSWTVGAWRCQDTSWGIIMEGRGRGLDDFGLFAATGGWRAWQCELGVVTEGYVGKLRMPGVLCVLDKWDG